MMVMKEIVCLFLMLPSVLAELSLYGSNLKDSPSRRSPSWFDGYLQEANIPDKSSRDSWWNHPSLEKATISKASCKCDDRLVRLEVKTEQLSKRNEEMNEEMQAMGRAMDRLWVEVRSRKEERQLSKQQQIVSFTAALGFSKAYLTDSELIVFDQVLVNNGGGFDPYSGIFTAPVSGVYLFSATILSGYNSTIETMMTLNGDQVARLYSGGFQNRGSGSSTSVLNLRAEDQVAVAVHYGNGDYVHGKWSSFTGTLLDAYQE